MGVDAKVILPSNPQPLEIAAALRSAFGTEVKVRNASIGNEINFYYAQFPDPEGRRPGDAELRQLAIFLDSKDNGRIYPGSNTQCSLGSFGGSQRIVDALADAFGGYVCYSDSEDEWVFRDRKDGVSLMDRVSPQDFLFIEIERAVGSDKATVLASIAEDAAALETVMDAYARYREAISGPSFPARA